VPTALPSNPPAVEESLTMATPSAPSQGAVARGYGAPGGKSTFRPQLTSLIDVMTILLVFLIKSFSTEGNIVTPSPDLELPFSTSEKPARLVTTIDITKNAVTASGTVIAPLDSFADSDSLLIPSLHEWMSLEKAKISDTTTTPEVLIQSDRRIPFNIVKRVMYTCSKSGFEDFSVLVLQEEE
jgi:biopolymer transport protein ExbD